MTVSRELAVLDEQTPIGYRATVEGLASLAAAWLVGYGNEGTRTAYLIALRQFADWCTRHGLELLQVARPHLDAYARELEAAGRAPATVARHLATLASFYAFAAAESVIDSSPAERLRRPRVSDESPRLGLDRDDLLAFLDAAEAAGPRDHALACLLSLNGLRVSEVCGADVDKLGLERGHHVLAVTRKRGKRALVPLAPRTVAATLDYVDTRETGPLLLANDGARLDRHDARRIVRRLTRAAGIDKRVSPHSLRHTFVTLSLDAGVSLRDVQDAAGHADPRTTRRYDRARHNLDRHPTYRLASFLAP